MLAVSALLPAQVAACTCCMRDLCYMTPFAQLTHTSLSCLQHRLSSDREEHNPPA